jgi:glycyl-tRNA synthetase beta chain
MGTKALLTLNNHCSRCFIKSAAAGDHSVATFLLEIGTEELPADFARLALDQLEPMVARDLNEQRLNHTGLSCTSTPRRIALIVQGLSLAAADLQEERKGPPAAQAFKDGEPTKAAIGFAQRCGLEPAALQIRDTPKGPFVFADVLERGRPTLALLAELIPSWLGALQGRRFMRWGSGERRFSRPIRWLVALLDEVVVPVTLQGSDPVVSAGNRSCGHRLVSASIEIPEASAYRQALATAGVEVDRRQRRITIEEAVDTAAAALNARPDIPAALLEELTDLVERPALIQGSIDEASLALPAEVLSTVMRAHQRYVPLYDINAAVDPLALTAQDALKPQFLCIANGLDQAADSIRRGNERVLKARLADAAFFIDADRAVASSQRRQQLERVTFAEGLGSLLDRCERLEWLADLLAQRLRLEPETSAHAKRAAHLCKHDLVSQMVGEFPELQGLMGGKYLLAEGEPRAVAQAVQEHYSPKGADDAPPSSDAGAVVALAERLELLLSIFAKGERPSGSSDPYALRRAGKGVLQILWNRGWRLDLPSLLDQAAGHWSEVLPSFAIEPKALASELGDFLRQRLVSQLEEQGEAIDLVQAVTAEADGSKRLLTDPLDALDRLKLLAQLRQNARLAPVQAVVQRASRLADKGDLERNQLSAADVVDPALFEQPSEAAMLEVIHQLAGIVNTTGRERYPQLCEALAASASTLGEFFDGENSVMVMADDEAVRRNRLNLLAVLRNQAAVLADFALING